MHDTTGKRSSAWRSFAWLAAGLTVATTGCGDDDICPSRIAVVISSPANGTQFFQDGGGSAPGVRTEVTVQTNLAAEEPITLEVLTPAGGTVPYFAAADADGMAVFTDVLIPAGEVTLRAIGTSAACGASNDIVTVTLVSDEACTLSIRQGSIDNAFYGLPVINTSHDADNVLPDFQGDLDIATMPRFDVEVFEVDPAQGTETSLGIFTADTSGLTSLAVTLGQGEKALRATCTAPGGGASVSSATTQIYVDTEAPACSLLDPSVRTTLVPEMDVDGDAGNGTQITFAGQVTPADDVAGENSQIQVDGVPFGGTPVDADGNGTATADFIIAGSYTVSFVAQDHAGNTCADARNYAYVNDGCYIQFVGPQSTINSDANADGADGLQADLLVQVDTACEAQTVVTDCGVGASTALVPAGGLTPVRATLCEDARCTASYACTILVTAPNGVQTAVGVDLQVDSEPPPAVTGLAAFASSRQSIVVTWTAPADLDGAAAAGYVIKIADEPLDESNFDIDGTAIAGTEPAAPGSTENVLVGQLRAGTGYYVAVATVDPAGNRSLAAAQGPIVPDFTGTGSIAPVQPNPANDALGYQLAAGDFNADGHSDLAAAAPFKQVNDENGDQFGVGTVYVYFGSTGGLGTVPDVTIEGLIEGLEGERGGQFGNGLTALDWDGDGIDDLAAGAPFEDSANGRVHIFLGGDGFAALTSASEADVTIGGAGGWFAGGGLGWSLATARFDDDQADDLIVSVPAGGGFDGGVAVLYGGATASSIMLSDLDSSGSGDATVLVIEDPSQDPATTIDDLFGQYVYNLGRTEGAGDTNDDIGVAYFEQPAAVVIRGRARPASPGVQRAQFDPAADLEIRNSTVDPTARFGAAMGSIADLNGDGAREIIVSGWRQGNNLGRVFLIDGDQVGTHNAVDIDVALLETDAGVTGNVGLGSAVVNNARGGPRADIDGDGREDLIVVGGMGDGQVKMFIWYGGAIPSGRFTPSSAQHTIAAPAGFTAFAVGDSDPTPMTAIWAGDVNADGLEDLAWADNIANQRDGLFELLGDGLF